MLTLTENASTIVQDITSNTQGAEALRISGGIPPEAGFAVSAADAPEPGDQVVEQDGAKVYLDSTASRELDDKVLDAQLDPAGNVSFSLGVQG